ncbi:MAG TPA: N-acetylneuraminate synthase [Brevundimonas sp.]|jgi:N-acetylneuraminate synthase|uniref:N-acetylneuraminate synthase n=1 Tax=Brevundimonas sp. TaxID=1871086 RepID=UPI002DE5B43A|nr:N-acetylneuraminate synthase [Brevundimonas sp.]
MADRVFIVAEAGVNHDGSVDDALTLVDVAAEAGADAVKFQTFRADALVTRRAAKADYQAANTGEAGGQADMLRRLELSEAAHRQIAERCRTRGVDFMSTAFDMEGLALLDGMGVPAIKIPSGDLTWGPMLLAAARTGRPLFVSTGMADLAEVRQALGVIAFGLTRDGDPSGLADCEAAFASAHGRAALAKRVTVLQCTTQYPAPPSAVNLRAMVSMGEAFGVPIGYSDHTLGIAVSTAAVALGARVIEKHFTLSRSRPGPDHAASLEPGELAALVRAIRDVEAALGDGVKSPSPVELPNRPIARRSLVASRAVSAGEVWTADAVTAKRPADGLSPMCWWDVADRAATRPYVPDEALDPEELR